MTIMDTDASQTAPRLKNSPMATCRVSESDTFWRLLAALEGISVAISDGCLRSKISGKSVAILPTLPLIAREDLDG